MKIRVSLACIGLACAPADAIITRHDVPDERYIALGEPHACVTGVAGGSGTLVHPRWVLTAAHVADSLGATRREIDFDGERRTIDLVVFHPTWKGNLDSPETTSDLALVRLDRAVEGVAVPGLYRGGDEIGARIVVAGVGMRGDGETGPTGDDGVRRAAHNRVDGIESDRWLFFAFDAPPRALALEGISGPGDSGGPAFIERDGRMLIAGVSSGNDGEGDVHCTYGSREFYARVSTETEWIEGVIRDRINDPAEELPDVVDVSSGAWPGTPAGELARAFVTAYNDEDEEALGAFERRYRDRTDSRGRSLDERVAGWVDLHNQFGPIDARTFVDASPDAITLEAASGRDRMTFTFELEGGKTLSFTGVRISVSGE